MSTLATESPDQESRMDEAEEIIIRMKECLDARSDSELAEKLGVGRASVSKWRKRNAVPNNQVVATARQTNTSTDYILFAKGLAHDLDAIELYDLDEDIVLEALRLSHSLGIFRLTVDGDDQFDDLWRMAHSISLLYGRAQTMRARLKKSDYTDEAAKLAAISAVFGSSTLQE